MDKKTGLTHGGVDGMNGLLYYPVANLFKYLFFFSASHGGIFPQRVPVFLWNPLDCVVATLPGRIRMRSGVACCFNS
jgi:hypothetical protein